MERDNILKKTVILLYYKKNLIELNDIESYVYGLEVLLLKFTHTLIFLVFGILNNNLPSVLVFLYLFSYIRSRIHGFHAKTRSQCLLYSIIMCIILNIGLIYKLPNNEIIFINMIFTIILCKIIPKSAPFLISIEILLLLLPYNLLYSIFVAELFSLLLYYIMHLNTYIKQRLM